MRLGRANERALRELCGECASVVFVGRAYLDRVVCLPQRPAASTPQVGPQLPPDEGGSGLALDQPPCLSGRDHPFGLALGAVEDVGVALIVPPSNGQWSDDRLRETADREGVHDRLLCTLDAVQRVDRDAELQSERPTSNAGLRVESARSIVSTSSSLADSRGGTTTHQSRLIFQP
jgi:hypothetical protein